MRNSIILVALSAALPAFAQLPYDLATTRDGSVLYFSYIAPSTGRDSKIYRWSQDAGVTVFGDRADLKQAPPLFGQHLYGTQTTGTDTVLYHAEPLCETGFGPGFNTCSIGDPNGRYGVFASFEERALWVDWFTDEEIWQLPD